MTEHFVRFIPRVGSCSCRSRLCAASLSRALQVVVAAAGMLFIFLVFSRQADAAPPPQHASPFDVSVGCLGGHFGCGTRYRCGHFRHIDGHVRGRFGGRFDRRAGCASYVG